MRKQEKLVISDILHQKVTLELSFSDTMYVVSDRETLFEADVAKKMHLAALCAAKYAETMSYEKYREHAQLVYANINEFNELAGIRLPWAERYLPNNCASLHYASNYFFAS